VSGRKLDSPALSNGNHLLCIVAIAAPALRHKRAEFRKRITRISLLHDIEKRFLWNLTKVQNFALKAAKIAALALLPPGSKTKFWF
jgi:hypothetical protein